MISFPFVLDLSCLRFLEELLSEQHPNFKFLQFDLLDCADWEAIEKVGSVNVTHSEDSMTRETECMGIRKQVQS